MIPPTTDTVKHKFDCDYWCPIKPGGIAPPCTCGAEAAPSPPPAPAGTGTATMERAKKLVDNLSMVGVAIDRLGAGELSDAEDLLLDFIATLTRQLAEAQQDTARLDWLEKHPMSVPAVHDTRGWQTKRASDLRSYGPLPTLREAINAAMEGD